MLVDGKLLVAMEARLMELANNGVYPLPMGISIIFWAQTQTHLNVGMEASVAKGLQAHECRQATDGQAHAGVRPEHDQRHQAQRWPCR